MSAMLHQGQRDILQAARRFNTVACGRRFGKTTLGLALAYYGAPHAPGGLSRCLDVGWFAPTYKLLDEAWRSARALPSVSSNFDRAFSSSSE